MRNLFKIGLVGALSFLLGAAPAFAQTQVIPAYSTGTGIQVVDATHGLPVSATVTATASFANFAIKGNATLAPTTTTSRVALPTADVSVMVRNTGASDAYIAFGNGTVTATTGGYLLKAGDAQSFDATGTTNLAAITASGSTTLQIATGTGAPMVAQAGGAGGGGGGAVTSVDGGLVTLGAQADAACGTDTGTCTAQGLLKRLNSRLTTINTTLGTPLQAGGSVGISGTLPAFASTPAFSIFGTLPAFAATPTFNCGTGCGSPTNFTIGGNAALSVTTATANVALPTADPVTVLTNFGASDLFFKLGTTSGVTAATTDTLLPSGRSIVLATGANTFVAAISQFSQATSLRITTGTGTPILGGANTAIYQATTSTAFPNTTIVGGLTSSNVVTPIAMDGGANVLVAGAVQAGAADSRGPVKVGGKYNASLPSLTDGNRGDVQLDAFSILKVSSNVAPSIARLASSANTTNATNVKASAGYIVRVIGYNTTAAVVYLKLYNKATSPTIGTDTPIMTIAIPPNGNVPDVTSGNMIAFATGLGYGLTTGATDADTTAPAAGAVVGLNIAYQ